MYDWRDVCQRSQHIHQHPMLHTPLRQATQTLGISVTHCWCQMLSSDSKPRTGISVTECQVAASGCSPTSDRANTTWCGLHARPHTPGLYWAPRVMTDSGGGCTDRNGRAPMPGVYWAPWVALHVVGDVHVGANTFAHARAMMTRKMKRWKEDAGG